jgi:hypothetical protein
MRRNDKQQKVIQRQILIAYFIHRTFAGVLDAR